MRTALASIVVTVATFALPALAAEPSATVPAASTPAAEPDERSVCAQSFEDAQGKRLESRYLDANRELLTCANPRCGDAIFRECSKMYAELQSAIPSVVFTAHEEGGTDRSDVTVSIDGNVVVQWLDGKPVQLDPGSHEFTFTANDLKLKPWKRTLVLRAGERFREVKATFQRSEAAPLPAVSVAPTAPIASDERPARGIPTATYVLGGVGLVALGGAAAFRAIGSSEYDELDTGCSPTCPRSDVDQVKQKYLLSNIALGLGAASLVGAAAFYIFQPSKSSGAQTALVLAPNAEGMSARLVGQF